MNRRAILSLAAAGAAAPALAKPATPRPARVIHAADGTFLHHRDWGTGRPVVFVHAWALTSDSWDAQASAAAEHGLRAITYDRRGHGRSGQPDGGYDFDTLADDLAAVIEGLNLSDLTLVSHSMGGGDVTRYLSRHGSARVARLVFVAPALPCLKASADNPFGAPAAYFEANRAQWRKDRGRWMADNTAPFVRPDTPKPAIDWIVAQMLGTPLKVWLDCNKSLVDADFRQELARIDRPTVVLHGDADASAPLKITGERVAALVPGAKLKVYPGAPHGLVFTDAEAINADLLAFIGS
jgi:pimeloyl-ACP methyl ester carboxylesterase